MNKREKLQSLHFEELEPSPGYERLVRCRDELTGLHALISIHSTKLGPAAGGCRMWAYPTFEEAVFDVERLSRGMSYKNAAANLPLGGGKAVIIGDAKTLKSPKLMRAFGYFVDFMAGSYYTAEDVGISPLDMQFVAENTAYVAGLESGVFASGDPSPVTARGVYLCIKEAVRMRLHKDSLHGVRITIQGLGHVGMHLAEALYTDGALLTVCDIHADNVAQAVERFGATEVSPDAIYSVSADVFAPCALGAVLSPEVISQLKVKVIAGAANNQLQSPECGELLRQRDILYATDYIVNGGGIINVAMEILGITDPTWGERRVRGLSETLKAVIEQASLSNQAINVVADQLFAAKLEATNV